MKRGSKNIDTILCDAIEIESVAHRKEYLDNACGGDADLRARVEELVANHLRAGGFLESPAAAVVAPVDLSVAIEQPGTMIGRYTLLEQIGEGGMGVVYVAEQTKPVRRKVALKIIKPGMDTRQVVARFEVERQAMALMRHPHIAKILDAGATDMGRPYFVMELVKGIAINLFCDQHKYDLRQRLELFVNVCRAVEHAHQKGVIHRDLKPSNVLVELHDAAAVPKVIDFGVAKATHLQLTEHSFHTQFNQMIGTPLYMTPEQAEMNGLDVDTRSDIYSLGVILYELLTGSTPFHRERLSEIGSDEIRRIVREEEPVSPSARLSTIKSEHLSTLAMKRGVQPRKLSQLVRGELDWVVMRALEKDRSRRYESASALVADVERYLADEPVEQIATVQPYFGRVDSVCFSPDGSLLAVGSHDPDQYLELWNGRTLEHVDSLRGHVDVVQSVAFAPDGKVLVSASSDRTVKLWDVSRRALLATLVGHTQGVLTVAFSPDGTTLATGGDQTVMIWKVDDLLSPAMQQALAK